MRRVLWWVVGTLLILSLACTVRIPGINLDLDSVEGSGNVVEETREVGAFSQIRLEGTGNLVVEQGESTSLRIEAEDNFMEYIDSEVENDTLVIGWEEGTIPITSERIFYYVTVEDLEALTLSGAGNVEVAALETGALRINLNGTGDLDFDDLTAETLDVELSGAGSLSISGSVDEQEIDLNAAGDYDARALESRIAAVTINGVGSATVWVTEELIASINGAGSIRYLGDPDVEPNINGVGNIEPLGE